MQILLFLLGWSKPEVDLRLPPIEAARPRICPHCGQPAWVDGSLWIVGHGTYARCVLIPEFVKIHVRRFRCKRCGKVVSVLPHWVLPRRQYAAPVILEGLRRFYLEGHGALEATAALGLRDAKAAWGTLKRWGAELLVSMTLWGWLGERFGVDGRAAKREQIRARLGRFLQEGVRIPGQQDRLAWIVHQSSTDRAYDRGRVWALAQGPAGAPRRPAPAGAGLAETQSMQVSKAPGLDDRGSPNRARERVSTIRGGDPWTRSDGSKKGCSGFR